MISHAQVNDESSAVEYERDRMEFLHPAMWQVALG